MLTKRQRAHARLRERRSTFLYRWIIRIMTAGFWLSVSLILIGLVVALIRGEPVGDEVDALSRVVPEALRLESQGVIDLGILALLLTPAATVVVALVLAIRQRDLVFVGTCIMLLVILLGGIIVGLI